MGDSGKKSTLSRRRRSSSRSDAKDLAGHKKLKSIVLVIDSSTYKEVSGSTTCYKISHDGESGCTPTLKVVFQSKQFAEVRFSYARVGSKMFSFPARGVSQDVSKLFSFRTRGGSQDIVSSLDLSAAGGHDPKKAAKWANTGFELPITTGRGLLPGVFKNWLYLIGFGQEEPKPNDGTSVWGQVYNVADGSNYPLDPPFCSYPHPDPRVLGPWKEDGLLVYTPEDNTLRVHNPVDKTWKTLVCGIVKMELRPHYSVQLCGNIFYTFQLHNLVLEAYDIVRKKPLPRVQFDQAEHFPDDFVPHLFVLSDGVVCFVSDVFCGRFLYLHFVIDYKPINPKPLLTKRMVFQCKGGRLMFITTE